MNVRWSVPWEPCRSCGGAGAAGGRSCGGVGLGAEGDSTVETASSGLWGSVCLFRLVVGLLGEGFLRRSLAFELGAGDCGDCALPVLYMGAVPVRARPLLAAWRAAYDRNCPRRGSLPPPAHSCTHCHFLPTVIPCPWPLPPPHPQVPPSGDSFTLGTDLDFLFTGFRCAEHVLQVLLFAFPRLVCGERE